MRKSTKFILSCFYLIVVSLVGVIGLVFMINATLIQFLVCLFLVIVVELVFIYWNIP